MQNSFPFPLSSTSNNSPFVAKVDEIMMKEQSNPNAHTNTLESEIDKIDYDLYGLTSEEVRIVGTVKRYRFFVPLQFG